jgi:hypothetical protein
MAKKRKPRDRSASVTIQLSAELMADLGRLLDDELEKTGVRARPT